MNAPGLDRFAGDRSLHDSSLPRPRDVIIGTPLRDYLPGTPGDDSIDGGDSGDDIRGRGGNDTLIGGSGSDWIQGEAGQDRIFGGEDGDYLDGGSGNDWISGEAGNDGIYAWSNGRDTLLGGDGDDYLSARPVDPAAVLPALTVDGGEGVDRLSLPWGGIASADIAIVLSIADFQAGVTLPCGMVVSGVEMVGIMGGAADDSITGGNLDDTLQGATGDDVLVGGEGNDGLDGGAGSNYLDGGAGRDFLEIAGTSADSNTLLGGSGDDEFFFINPVAVDVLDGGEGVDLLWIDSAFVPWKPVSLSVETILAGGVTVLGGANIAGIEQLYAGGSGHDDTLSGGPYNDWFTGRGGDDLLAGGFGVDRLDGNAGNDTLLGGGSHDEIHCGSGNDSAVGGDGDDWLIADSNRHSTSPDVDTLVGGLGNDTYKLFDRGDDIIVEAEAEGTDTVVAARFSYTLGGSLENLRLQGKGALEGVGTESANHIQGSPFANRLVGAGGNDSLDGDDGADELLGGDGADALDGGEGADRLLGGAGADTLAGGVDLAVDTFVFDVAATGADADVVLDFWHGRDRIEFSLAAFPGLGATGPLDAAQFRSGDGVSSAVAATDRLLYDTSTGTLYYDADGSGGAALALAVAEFNVNARPSAGDILVT